MKESNEYYDPKTNRWVKDEKGLEFYYPKWITIIPIKFIREKLKRWYYCNCGI